MATILMTGATGLIGSHLAKKWLSAGHQLIMLTRNKDKVKTLFGPTVLAVNNLDEIVPDQKLDGVVNLAGAPIADARWTQARKSTLEQSRIELTHKLINWLATHASRPQWLISGSAVGWYGDQHDHLVTEKTPAYEDYAHQLCEAWEQAARKAETLGIRVCIIRTGLVLAPHGGFLQRVLLPFKLGLGGRIGSGRQFMPWIHLTDIVNLIDFLTHTPQASGVFNATAPAPVTNADFTKSLAAQLQRPALLPLPALLLKLVLGEMADLLLTGQQAVPEKATALGFKFAYTDVRIALADVLSP